VGYCEHVKGPSDVIKYRDSLEHVSGC